MELTEVTDAAATQQEHDAILNELEPEAAEIERMRQSIAEKHRAAAAVEEAAAAAEEQEREEARAAAFAAREAAAAAVAIEHRRAAATLEAELVVAQAALDTELGVERAERALAVEAAVAAETAALNVLKATQEQAAAKLEGKKLGAATTVQAFFRGWKARKAFKVALAAQRKQVAAKRQAEEAAARMAALEEARRNAAEEVALAAVEEEQRAVRAAQMEIERQAEEDAAAAAAAEEARAAAAKAAAERAVQDAAAASIAKAAAAKMQEEAEAAEKKAKEQVEAAAAARKAAADAAQLQAAEEAAVRKAEEARLERVLKEERSRLLEEEAAAVRGQVAAKEAARLREQEAMVATMAATTIQAAWRGFSVRREQQVALEAATMELLLLEEVFHPAATSIQAWWRGTRLRRRLQRVKDAALFDDDDDDFNYEEVDLGDFDLDDGAIEEGFARVPSPVCNPEAAVAGGGGGGGGSGESWVQETILGHTSATTNGSHNSSTAYVDSTQYYSQQQYHHQLQHGGFVTAPRAQKAPLSPPKAGAGVREAWGASGDLRVAPPTPAHYPEDFHSGGGGAFDRGGAGGEGSAAVSPPQTAIRGLTPGGYRGSMTPSVNGSPPYRSEKAAKIGQEWGFNDSRTADAMMRRAKRLRGKKKKTASSSSSTRRERTSPLAKLLQLQRQGAGVHQPPKFAGTEGVAGGRGRKHQVKSSSYEWTHEQRVVHRGVDGGAPVRFPPIPALGATRGTRNEGRTTLNSGKVKLPHIGKNLDGSSR